MRKFDQCVEIAGEPARRWRLPLTEHREGYGRESGRGLTDGLREFIEVDNERALDVGALRRGTGAPEEGSDVMVTESADELTLRAREVNTLKALTNVDHIELVTPTKK